jgi:hypothetical protein
MPFEKPAKDALRFLFAEYLKGPAVHYSIQAAAKKHKVDIVELSDFMLDRLWIRERWVYPDNNVVARITLRGIEQIDPVYVRNKLKHVIGGLGDAGGRKELLELLENKLEEYSLTMDLIKQLDDLGLIKILHPANQIVVELTPDGWKYFEKGSKTFFTLMTY